MEQNVGNVKSMDEATLRVRLASLEAEAEDQRYRAEQSRKKWGNSHQITQHHLEMLERYEDEAEQVKEALKKRP